MAIYNHERWISGKHRPNHNKESYAYEQWISGKHHAKLTSFITVSFRRSSRTPPPSCLMSRPIFRERILCGPPLSWSTRILADPLLMSKLSGICWIPERVRGVLTQRYTIYRWRGITSRNVQTMNRRETHLMGNIRKCLDRWTGGGLLASCMMSFYSLSPMKHSSNKLNTSFNRKHSSN